MKKIRFILLLGLFGCLQVICSERGGSDSFASDSDASDGGVVKSPNIVHLNDSETTQTNALYALTGSTVSAGANLTTIAEVMVAGRVDLEDLESTTYRRESKDRDGVRSFRLLPDASGDRYYASYDHITGRQVFYLPTVGAEIDGVGYDTVLVTKLLTEESMKLSAAAAAAAGATPPAGRSIRQLPCGHAYHVGCINRSFTSCGPKCPICTVSASKTDMKYVHPRCLTGVRDGKCYSGSSVDCICGDVIVGAKDKCGTTTSLKKHSRAGGSAAVGGGSSGGAGDGARKARRTTGAGGDLE